MAEKPTLQALRSEIDDELAQLQLDEMRENRDRRLAQRDQKQRNQKAFEASLAEGRAIAQMAQDGCPHKKGGKDMAGLHFGSSPNYAVIKHTLPMGEVLVLCQRCMKEWRRPIASEFDSKRDYQVELKVYREALNFPTDNVPSGTHMFQLTRDAA